MTVKVGTLSADLDLDGNPFERNLDRAMATGAQRASQIGDKMTAGVTLPMVAAGGAAVKLGIDLDTTFSRMVGLAGVPAGEIDGLKESVLGLAGETGRAPQELADALYDAASAGLTSAQAMDAVEIAARGAAAGMGTTGEIVGLVASATAAYGAANIDAAKATDILTATIRAGRADPTELAGTLGRILPIAAQLGVGFDEVGGAVAYLSNVFGDTGRTVTAVSGLLVKMVSPSQQGRDALEEMGTSAEELQSAIDERGLMGALELLREKGFAGNQQALRALFDDIEGYQGALALLNDESGSLAGTMQEVAGSSGALGEAFSNAAETDGFKLQQAVAKIQTALIDLGGQIAPFVALVATGIGTVADVFGALPDGVQTAVLAFGALLAAVGPLLSIGGRVAATWGTMSKVFDAAATGAFSLAGNLRSVATGAAAMAAAGLAVKLYGDMMRDAANEGEDFAASVRRSFDPTTAGYAETQAALEDLRGKISELDDSVDDSFFGRNTINKDFNESITTAADDLRGFEQEMAAALERADQLATELGVSSEEAYRMATSQEVLAAALDPTTGHLDTQAAAAAAATKAQEQLEDAIKGVTNALRSQFDPFFAATDAMLANEDAQRKVEEAHWAVTKASDDLAEAIEREGEESWAAKEAADKLTQAQWDLEDAEREAGRSALDVATAMAELKTRVEEGNLSIDEGARMLDQWVQQGLITEGQAEKLKLEMFYATLQAQELGRQNPTPTLGLNASAFWAEVARVRNELSTVLGRSSWTAHLSAGFAAEGRWTGGPVLPDNDYIVGERGPELLRMTGGAGVVESAPRTQAMRDSGAFGGPGGSTSRNVALAGRDVVFQVADPREALDEAEHRMRMIELGNP